MQDMRDRLSQTSFPQPPVRRIVARNRDDDPRVLISDLEKPSGNEDQGRSGEYKPANPS